MRPLSKASSMDIFWARSVARAASTCWTATPGMLACIGPVGIREVSSEFSIIFELDDLSSHLSGDLLHRVASADHLASATQVRKSLNSFL